MGRRPIPAGQISPAERRVLAGLADGLTAAEIAAQQCLAQHTVHEHAQSARRRLGAATTLHAVAICIRRGLLEEQPAPTPHLV